MLNNSRKCPDCGAAVEGRPNKIFCNGVCKGCHFRNTNLDELPSEATASSALLQTLPLSQSPAPTFVPEWDEEQEETVEKVRADQEKAAALHGRFDALVREMLESVGKTLTARRIKNLLSDAARLSTVYVAHPYIKVPHTQVGDRLEAIYDIHDILQEATDEIAGKMMWQSKETSFELPKKWRKHLRELLIED